MGLLANFPLRWPVQCQVAGFPPCRLYFGSLYFAVFWAIGHMSPILSEIFEAFGETVTWQLRAIGSIHFVPAIILGSAAGVSLIWKDRITDRKSSGRINVVALG